MALSRIGRRAFLTLSASSLVPGQSGAQIGAQSGKGATAVFTPQQFLDPATEFDLFRLTDPQYNAWLPLPQLHFISRRGRFLIHTSDRTGAQQAYRLDWHTGQSRQLTGAAALDRSTVALSLDDRSLLYFDGPSLKQLTIGNLHERTIAQVEAGWERAPGFSLSVDAATTVWVERQGERSRIRTARVGNGEVRTVLEARGGITDPQVRLGHPQMSYRLDSVVRIVNLDGRSDAELKTSPGQSVGQALWSPSGQTLIYLSIPTDRSLLTTLREVVIDQGTDRLVAKTSQFASFGINGDSSVFVGASRSQASPYILLLLRSVRRELTICEHRSSDASSVDPVFSPDSQNIFFTSDRRGKRSIYRAHVEKFVEETGEEPADSQ